MIYDNLALANALIFDNAYHILKQRMDIGTVSHSQLDMSLAVPVAVNCSFSCEMLLKSMLPIGTRGHGLNDLFTQLTTSEQSGIVDGTIQLLRLHKTDYTTENFYSDLNHHDKAFIQWRYFHEKHDGKKKLTDYLRKNPPYDEKGETVLYELGLECIKDAQGKRSIYDEIDDYLAQGMTPSEIMRKGSRFRYYEKVIKSAYMDKRINEVPIIKDMHVEYHFGPAGTGKTKLVADLCKRYGRDKIYLVDDYKTGGFDKYLEFDAPPILFMDEFKGVDLSYGQLLSILDRYTIKQTHSRYSNTFNLWTQVYITSVYPIEELFQIMVDSRLRKTDDMNQLMRRINTIVYHYSEDGENKTFSMSASEYKDYNDMMIRLHKATDGFRKVSPSEVQQVPFETKEGR